MSDKEHWKQEPDEHDYPAAASYLSLILPEGSVNRLVEELRAAPIGHWQAKDLLRASNLPLLPPDNPHVASDLKKVKMGVGLRRSSSSGVICRGAAPLTIADGYHRICASWRLNEDADIPCRMADYPPSG